MRKIRLLRTIRFIICFLLLCPGCDYVYGLLHKEGAEEKELVGEILPQANNTTVEEIQTLLKIYGYNPGKTDGMLGAKTRDAIERFQRENGLKVTRFVDHQTWAKLKIFKQNGFIVEDAIDVRMVQIGLKNAGFHPGEVDGELGPKTMETIKKFQQSHGLRTDGNVGYQTLSALSQYITSPVSP